MEEHPKAIVLNSNESLNLYSYDGIFRTSSSSSSSSSKKCSKVEWLKRMVKLIVFCLVLGLFFSVFSLFPHSFSVYFSTFLFFVLNHAMERKYMFLVCNIGILFLLATSSASSSSSSLGNYCSFPHPHQHHHHHHNFEHDVIVGAASDEESDSEDQLEQQNEDEEEENEEGICRGELLDEELDEELEEDEGCFTDEVDEEEEEGEEEEEEEEGKRRELEIVVSTEELNKKIEDFIRKMKEEMRIEAAQTPLIAV